MLLGSCGSKDVVQILQGFSYKVSSVLLPKFLLCKSLILIVDRPTIRLKCLLGDLATVIETKENAV